jgi:hypothetical protein
MKKAKRKRINQGVGMFVTTKVAVKIDYTPRMKKRKEEYEPQEFVLKIIANNIRDRHRDGETRIAKIMIEL